MVKEFETPNMLCRPVNYTGNYSSMESQTQTFLSCTTQIFIALSETCCLLSIYCYVNLKI